MVRKWHYNYDSQFFISRDERTSYVSSGLECHKLAPDPSGVYVACHGVLVGIFVFFVFVPQEQKKMANRTIIGYYTEMELKLQLSHNIE